MNRRLFTSLKLSLVASVMLAIGASQAHALDGKVYPGSMCVPWTNGYLFQLSSSAMTNPSSSGWLDLDCPVIHDSIGYNSITSGWMLVRDRHSSSAVYCNLNSLYPSGSGFAGSWTPFQYSSNIPSPANAQSLVFWTGLPATANQAHDYFSCHIPPTYGGNASSIISYSVTEGGPNE